jgi:hypothetical protein
MALYDPAADRHARTAEREVPIPGTRHILIYGMPRHAEADGPKEPSSMAGAFPHGEI